jgi:glycolate oxidase iron-sulfur subunit
MQTALADFIRQTAQGAEAEAILRSCVHCGFCLPACPTYQLLGDELDSPRGRIYLIKQLLEGTPPGTDTQLHLDRCLTCRACESACPSGVRYGRLLDLGRELTDTRLARGPAERIKRWLLRLIVPSTARVRAAVGAARLVRPLLPSSLKARVPPRIPRPPPVGSAPRPQWPKTRHARRIVILEGCVTPVLGCDINPAAASVLDRIGISALRVADAGCCGALDYHLSAHSVALARARRNVDALWAHIEGGVEAVVLTSSACTSMVADYGRLLQHDPGYAPRAARISALTRDITQLVAEESPALAAALAGVPGPAGALRVAFQAPCTLQHALKASGLVEPMLRAAGFTLTAVPDGGRCCGSAGTYSLLQPQLSARLRESKLAALAEGEPDLIATANIGCLAHLRGADNHTPVYHWVELLAARLAHG